jgi:hypothetical protein
MAQGKIELHLPGLVIGVDDIKITDIRRWFGRTQHAGPYLVIGRASGLALDTGLQYDPGHRVASYSPHAQKQQLWYLRPGGVKDEVAIISAANGLAWDSGRDTSDGNHPHMQELNGEPWQRWRFEPTSDGIGFFIKSPHNGNYLTLWEEAREHLKEPWHPWCAPRDGNQPQQWIFSQPYGNI